ncbi:MAG: phospholipase D-like domain-containing protein [Crocinitomicaceae bacterium]
MAEFLTTNGTSYQIENIIREARHNLVLVSPYLQISKTFYERLKDANNRGVKVQIVYGKDELKPNERNSLAALSKLELHYFENLHAKCYYNEESMVITSMNMYEFSEKNNREMGVFLTKSKDSALYNQAVAEAESIIQSSEEIVLGKTKRKIVNEKKNTSAKNSKKPERGYCIRCEARIPYSLKKPYCKDCFAIWSKYEDSNYEENVCHACGEFETTTMEKPIGYDCYKLFEK